MRAGPSARRSARALSGSRFQASSLTTRQKNDWAKAAGSSAMTLLAVRRGHQSDHGRGGSYTPMARTASGNATAAPRTTSPP